MQSELVELVAFAFVVAASAAPAACSAPTCPSGPRVEPGAYAAAAPNPKTLTVDGTRTHVTVETDRDGKHVVENWRVAP